jgi:hypothetical protein
VPRGESSAALFHYVVLTTTTPNIIRKPIHMTLDLTPQLKTELEQTAHHCSIPPEKLAALFVEDSLRSYRDSRDELRDSIDREDI